MARVVSVSRCATRSTSKRVVASVRLVAGLGVRGDVHAGATVRHRSRIERAPAAPNLRQVHLLHEELLDELRAAGFGVGPGVLGENVTTRGVPLLELPVGTRLTLGADAVVEITGLRNPCAQLDAIAPGLMAATLDRDSAGARVRKAGVMAVVLVGGDVRAGDGVVVERPPPPHRALSPV